MLSLGCGAAAVISDLHRCGFVDGADQSLFAERNLEAVVRARARARKRGLRCGLQVVLAELIPSQCGFCLARTPRHSGDAPECNADIAHAAVVEIECDRGRSKRELVRGAVANLQIERSARPGTSRHGEES